MEILSGLGFLRRCRLKHRMALDAEPDGCSVAGLHRRIDVYGQRQRSHWGTKTDQRLVGAKGGKTASLAALELTKSGHKSATLAGTFPANF